MASQRKPDSEFGRGAKAREALISAVLEILAKKSIDTATTREISAKSGQNISAIAYYFGSKEGLYLAAVERVADTIRTGLKPVLGEIERYLDVDERTAQEAIGHIRKLIRTTLGLHRQTLAFSEIIAREQLHPTSAFSILYDGALQELQTCGARLIAVAVGGDEDDREFKIRFHAILGEALSFRMARETIMRGVGWKDFGADQVAIVSKLIEEHVNLILTGLMAKGGKEA